MENRRSFLKKTAGFGTLLMVPQNFSRLYAEERHLTTKKPQTAAVVWYSQAGHTERMGRLIAARLQKAGLSVTFGDYRVLKANDIVNNDLIVFGTPVYYYDVPENLKEWVKKLPPIKGKGIAAYCTYGGEGHNEHNTATKLLDLLYDRGGFPLGIACFGNMSTFAPTWSYGKVARILKYRHLPGEKTYEKARKFSSNVLAAMKKGKEHDIDFECSIFSPLKVLNTMWWTKKVAIRKHTIDAKKCIQCGLCVEKCPVGAIDIEKFKVDNGKCILCVGCVNNCPEGAHDMIFMGKKVYGFKEFLKRNKITIKEPRELARNR